MSLSAAWLPYLKCHVGDLALQRGTFSGGLSVPHSGTFDL